VRRLAFLNGLRGIAALNVVLFHQVFVTGRAIRAAAVGASVPGEWRLRRHVSAFSRKVGGRSRSPQTPRRLLGRVLIK